MHTCIRYRARNGFGGMNIEHVDFTTRRGDTSASAWNRHCADKNLHDESAAEGMADIITPK